MMTEKNSQEEPVQSKELSRGKLTQITIEFLAREELNWHTENVVMLAEHFGTKTELEQGRELLEYHRKHHKFVSGSPMHQRYEVLEGTLSGRFLKAIDSKGIDIDSVNEQRQAEIQGSINKLTG